MKAHVLTPVGPVFEGEVEGIQLPGIEGGFEVRKDHSPLVSILDVGKLVVKVADKPDKNYAISGGFTEIKDNHVIVMAEEAIATESIDTASELAKQIELEAEIRKMKIFTDEHKRAKRELRIVKNRIKVAKGSTS